MTFSNEPQLLESSLKNYLLNNELIQQTHLSHKVVGLSCKCNKLFTFFTFANSVIFIRILQYCNYCVLCAVVTKVYRDYRLSYVDNMVEQY